MSPGSTQVLNSSRVKQLLAAQVSERIFRERRVQGVSIPPAMGISGNLEKPQSFAAEFNFADQREWVLCRQEKDSKSHANRQQKRVFVTWPLDSCSASEYSDL
jgi:hypothetical protein